MNNYRITFLHNIECDYWGKNKRKLQAESFPNFNQLHEKYYPLVDSIKGFAKELSIKYIWHFYEPFIEITWLSDSEEVSEKLFKRAENFLDLSGVRDYHRHYPKNGNFADWFCKNELEREFGARTHSLCSELTELFYKYKDPIECGKGKREQVKRTIHRICNPLGLNYMDEAYVCFSRGLICLLFRFFKFERAVWIYTKIFRQKF